MAYLIIFGFGLLFTMVTFVLGELFDMGGGDADAGGGLDADGSPSPFSSRILFVFMTAFGGFGYLATTADWPVWGDVGAAVVGGLFVAGGTYFLIVLPMSRQQGSVKVSFEDFLNLEGEITSEIPEGGVGRVTLIAPSSGARVSQAARSLNGERMSNGTVVRVVHVGAGGVTVNSIAVSGSAPAPGKE